MDLQQYTADLNHCSLFEGMTRKEIASCSAGAHLLELQKGQVLTLPEALAEIYLVLRGHLNVFLDSGMNASLAHTLGTGDCFGIAFCAQHIPCHSKLAAVEKTVLLRIPYEKLLEPEDTRGRMLENLLALTSWHLLTLAEKICHTQSHSVRVKLSVYLRDQMHRCGGNRFELGMKRSALAEYLCVSYPAMLRELTQMQKEGLLLIQGDQVNITNEEKLIESGSEYTIL